MAVRSRRQSVRLGVVPFPSRVGILLLALASACGQKPAGSTSDAGATEEASASDPEITTALLAGAFVKHAYEQPVAAENGTPPYSWSLQSTPVELKWIAIDAATGVLSGTPETVSSGKAITVLVKDAKGKTDQKAFPLEVVACVDGERLGCTTASQGACMVGAEQCEDGRFGACAGGGFSTDVSKCGPSCEACGPSADRCVDGRCACGTVTGSGPCEGSHPVCCEGECVDTQNGDPDHCGSCATACDKNRANVVRQCTGAVCDYPCQAGFARCPAGSTAASCDTNLSNDANNCGACGRPCGNTGNVAKAGCSNRGCFVATCVGGSADCDGRFDNGCEVNTANGDLKNCGGCGKDCAVNAKGATGCTDGRCICPQGQLLCGTACIDPKNDKTNCGGCGVGCEASMGKGAWCRDGSCTLDCPVAGQTRCPDGACTDFVDSSHCGNCDTRCGQYQKCSSLKVCVSACPDCGAGTCCPPKRCNSDVLECDYGPCTGGLCKSGDPCGTTYRCE